MDFAEIRYLENGSKVWFKPFIRNLPETVYRKYIMAFPPVKMEEIKAYGGSGLKITFPVHKDNKDPDLELRLIKKTAAILMDKKIDIVINREGIPFMHGFKEVTGGIAMAFFMNQIINEAAKAKGIDLSKAEVVIIDGGGISTYAAMYSVKEEVNKLWIQTERKEKLAGMIDMIYDYSGLLAECFESVNNPIMANGDIIINCKEDMEDFDNIFKKGAVYVDTSSIEGKSERILKKRGDMLILNNCRFKIGADETDAYGAETYFLIKIKEFQKIFETGKSKINIENLAPLLINGSVKVSGI